MRWSIVRLIWLRELRDQLRDRRTVFMMAVLPILLYPLLGLGLIQFAFLLSDKPSVIGVYPGSDGEFPPRTPPGAGLSPVSAAACFALAGPGGGLDRLVGTAVLVQASQLRLDYPLLISDGKFTSIFYPPAPGGEARLLERAVGGEGWLRVVFLDRPDRAPLDDKEVDLILSAETDFWSRLEAGERPVLEIQSREGDERSQTARKRMHAVLERWTRQIREVRFLRHGLPADFDSPFTIKDPERAKSSSAAAADDLFDMLVRVFPFVLVMWSLAGALYPAVDLCAGEKERGTMETLLISPASRTEIVWGKFLTIWIFSAATALLNLASMGATTALLSGLLPHAILRPAALLWCVLLVLPLSAFFSALCLAVGAYARSSKEGQHYLMPLFLLTMPLIFLTLAPGVELSPLYSLVPVTGVALLLQRLMAAASLDQVPWLYFGPVLAPMVLYGWLALRWAIDQFQREEVLFREAERLDLRLWLGHLFRDKEPLPSSGQAFFCFALIMVLQWFALGLGSQLSLLTRAGVSLVAFVATPPVLMAVMLTTKPRHGLALRWPAPKAWLLAVLLAVLLLPPLAELTRRLLEQFPDLKRLLTENSPLADALVSAAGHDPLGRLHYFLVLALLPAVCEELAFRGFILTGLRGRFRPWTAILLSSFLFALLHLNVFQFLPSFFLGVVLGLLAVRTSSVLPGMLFHLLHNTLVIIPVLLGGQLGREDVVVPSEVRLAVAIGCALLAAPILGRMAWRIRQVDRPTRPQPPEPEPTAEPMSSVPAR
ncbi:MAG TPA: ABC transporter permease subunit/CPBP intramembrane protease [Gemmataceae bacterium]|nr:ABC transporter permease subunit/CPBP intramembrane protease [Gemmataceae bacterium]